MSPLWLHGSVAAVAIGVAFVVSDPAPETQEAFSFQDPAIDESSGLVQRGDLVLTVNDSGGDPVVYAVDPGTGATVGRTTYADQAEDVEAMALGPDGTVWVGDIGDNDADRPSVSVYAVPRVGRGDATVAAKRYELTYRGGPRDAETLLVDPADGRLYVVSKGVLGGKVYAAPRRLSTQRTNVLAPVADVDGLITDGTFTPDGRRVLLRGYGRVWVADPHDDWEYLASMGLPSQPQGEGIAPGRDPDRVLVSSEGRHATVLDVLLSDSVVTSLRAAGGAAGPSGSGGSGGSDGPGGSDESSGSGAAAEPVDDATARPSDGSSDDSGPHVPRRVLRGAAVVVVLVGLGVAAALRARGSRRRRW